MFDAEHLCMKCMSGFNKVNFCVKCGNPRITKQEMPTALPLRTILNGRYLVGRMLGAGGFGITYLGYDMVDNKRIAIKEFMPGGMVRRSPGQTQMQIVSNPKDYEDSMQRFLDEARMIYQYQKNPHILQVYGLFRENQTAYYIMEFLEGTDLKNHLKNRGGRLTWEEVKSMALQVVDALMVLHAGGVVHRDISPDNIFIAPNGKATLIDFGAARLFMAQRQLTVILKRKYAPIEQYETKGRQGPWTDIYALAATMYHALTGELPPEATSRAYRDEIKTFRECGVLLDERVERTLYHALRVEPEERYQNVVDFRNDLLGIGKNGKLSCLSGVFEGMELTITDEITVGRSASVCQLVYPQSAKGVSNVHCKFSLKQPGMDVAVIDLGSTYGTWVNGVRLEKGGCRKIVPGDKISFGENQIWRFYL